MSNIYYPLTIPQNEILLTEKFYPNTGFANISQTLSISGSVDIQKMEHAINAVLSQNDALRMRMEEVKGQVKQYVCRHREYKLELFDFDNNTYKYCTDEWISKKTEEPFMLFDSELYYFALLKINNTYKLYLKVHHLITDAWGMSLLENQIDDYYKKLLSEKSIETNNSPSYIDFINKQQKYTSSEQYSIDKEFWNKKFENATELISIKDYGTDSYSISARRNVTIIPKPLDGKIGDFCKSNSISMYSLFLSSLLLYISKLVSRKYVAVGTVFHNRSGTAEKSTAGVFISSTAFNIDIGEDWTFMMMVNEVTKNIKSILRHHKYPYSKLLQDLRKSSQIAGKLFDVFFSYQNTTFNVNEEWNANGYEPNPIAIHISDRQNTGELKLEVDFQIKYFTKEEISCFICHWLTLLDNAISKPEVNISEMELLSETEINNLIDKFNNTGVEYEKNRCIQTVFEEQVTRTPNNIALEFNGKNLTYKELNNKANKLACLLKSKGVNPNDIIGLMIKRSVEMMVGILAILKAGAAYLPIDPGYPADRINYMLEDSNASMLITSNDCMEGINFYKEIISIENDLSEFETDNMKNVNDSKDLAYIIYTSGSMGLPKGVMIEHKAVINFIKGVTDRISFTPDKSILALTTISFDIFVLETILPLSKGLKVVIADEEQQMNPFLLAEVIKVNRIDMLQMTPSRMQMLVNNGYGSCLNNVKEIMIGGEAFPQQLLDNLANLTCAKIYNMYGPTETTVWSTIKELKPGDSITIGKPIANTGVYIMNIYGNILPDGYSGELYISGDGVARGYLNQHDLELEKFVQNHYTHGERMYKTGDIARLLTNGEIECLGRADHQVKVRGYRIELGEIENILLNYEGIKAAAAEVWTDSHGNGSICAYYVSDSPIDENSLCKFMLISLPEYMLPSHFMHLDKLPYTQNGKIDRKMLPEPDKDKRHNEQIIEASNEMEESMSDIWKKVMQIDSLSMIDNFFSLGGDSIKAIQIAAEVQKSGKIIKTKDIYLNPTVRALCKFISENANTDDNISHISHLINPGEMEEIFDVLEYKLNN